MKHFFTEAGVLQEKSSVLTAGLSPLPTLDGTGQPCKYKREAIPHPLSASTGHLKPKEALLSPVSHEISGKQFSHLLAVPFCI